MISHLGAMISVVNGALMARRFKGVDGTVGATCIGEGATSTGAFHEALNQAAVEKLPLVLVVANNQYAYSTPTDRQFACARSRGQGASATASKATRSTAPIWPPVSKSLGDAVRRARDGHGPQLVVARLLRLVRPRRARRRQLRRSAA